MKLSKQINSNKKKKSKEINRLFLQKSKEIYPYSLRYSDQQAATTIQNDMFRYADMYN